MRNSDTNNKRLDFTIIYIIVAILMFCVLASSCQTIKKVYVPVHDTLVQKNDVYHTNEVFKHDSIYIEKIIKGDTFIDIRKEWHKVFVYDTLRITDSIDRKVPVPYEVEKIIKETPLFWKICGWIGIIFLIGLVIVVVIKIKT